MPTLVSNSDLQPTEPTVEPNQNRLLVFVLIAIAILITFIIALLFLFMPEGQLSVQEANGIRLSSDTKELVITNDNLSTITFTMEILDSFDISHGSLTMATIPESIVEQTGDNAFSTLLQGEKLQEGTSENVDEDVRYPTLIDPKANDKLVVEYSLTDTTMTPPLDATEIFVGVTDENGNELVSLPITISIANDEYENYTELMEEKTEAWLEKTNNE